MKAYNDELQNQFRKQQEKVSKVEVENFKLLEDLQTQDNHALTRKKEQNASQKGIEAQLEEIEKIKEKCERETENNKRLDDKLKTTQAEIIQLKRK